MVRSGIQFLQEERHRQRPKERGCVQTRPKKTHKTTALEGVKKVIPKSMLEISSGNAVRVIGRWSESNGEIAEGNIVELLSNSKPMFTFLEGWLASIYGFTSNSSSRTRSMEKARSKLRGSFSPSASSVYPFKKSAPISLRATQ